VYILRNPETDKAIEEKFGKPDSSRSFIDEGLLCTPMGKWKLWRLDSMVKENLFDSIN